MHVSKIFTLPFLSFTNFAMAGSLHIENRIPVEISIDNVPAVELRISTSVQVPLDSGDYTLTVWIGGNPNTIKLTVPVLGHTTLVVGETGITTHLSPPIKTVIDDTPRDIEIRSTAIVGVTFIIDTRRITLEPAAQTRISLPSGEHIVSLRSRDATVIWAEGTLTFSPGETLIVQLRDGMMPEILGADAEYIPAHAL